VISGSVVAFIRLVTNTIDIVYTRKVSLPLILSSSLNTLDSPRCSFLFNTIVQYLFNS